MWIHSLLLLASAAPATVRVQLDTAHRLTTGPCAGSRMSVHLDRVLEIGAETVVPSDSGRTALKLTPAFVVHGMDLSAVETRPPD